MESLAPDELVVMGMEGSANKIAVGIVTSTGRVLSNPRRVHSRSGACTSLTPPRST